MTAFRFLPSFRYICRMKKKLPIPVICGLIGVLYFAVTMVIAFAFGGDQEGTMVIAQMTNIPLTILFACLSFVLPVSITSSLVFQLIVSVVMSFVFGIVIGTVLHLFVVWRKRRGTR